MVEGYILEKEVFFAYVSIVHHSTPNFYFEGNPAINKRE